MADAEWQIYVVNEVREWIDTLDEATHARVVASIDLLAETGPGLGRPLVDTIHSSAIANLKELRPGTVRILFAFDPWRSSILLVAGDKAGRWNEWYTEAIPLAEQRYETYLKERIGEEGEQR
ncbi:MAG: type II toxin-antitoxin system RelE/ParE family toxin [Sporichthyaceae bacterium]|nr:type II toxin-antitoxin system RelE/ParE family toxin [Sporichthyaceae bacterium]